MKCDKLVRPSLQEATQQHSVAVEVINGLLKTTFPSRLDPVKHWREKMTNLIAFVFQGCIRGIFHPAQAALLCEGQHLCLIHVSHGADKSGVVHAADAR